MPLLVLRTSYYPPPGQQKDNITLKTDSKFLSYPSNTLQVSRVVVKIVHPHSNGIPSNCNEPCPVSAPIC